MTTLMTELDDTMEMERPGFFVVHPLDDVPEEKVDTEHLGPMQMTRTVKVCLFALRGYLLLMCGLLAFRAAQLAGAMHG
jgi:hypothetical protein